MTAVRSFYHLFVFKHLALSKNEFRYLEADLFVRIYKELKDIIKTHYMETFRLMKLNKEKENAMLEANFIRYIINDILSSGDYNLSGIAYYTDTPEDIIYELAIGSNMRPTLILARKIIDLHRLVRPSLYREIINKIAAQFLSTEGLHNTDSGKEYT